MERTEPTLVPEWLRNSGNLSGGSTASHSDDHAPTKFMRNKSSLNGNGHDLGRSYGSDRPTSSYFSRNSSSHSHTQLRSYSSFGRSSRDRDWEKDTYESRERERSVFGDHRHRDFSESFGVKFEKDGLRRSQSMISGKHGDAWPKRVGTDFISSSGSNNNSLRSKGSPVGDGRKSTFGRDFPSLGAEERQSAPEIGRVPSPGLSTAIQSLPVGTSAAIGGEKWTSALAEVPVIVGSSEIGVPSAQQVSPSSSVPAALSTSTGLNMAETVAQVPPRIQTSPQLSSGTQRLEELAIKQSRQLIPMTPSMPKALVLNSLDKQKAKGGQQQHPVASSLPVSHSPRGGPMKPDFSKSSNVGKLHVLKPAREKNGVSPAGKDNLTPSGGSKGPSSPVVVPSSSGSPAARGAISNTALPNVERKPVLTVLEKRPTPQAQSRSDFFNLVRKKSMANSSAVPDPASMVSSSVPEKPSELEVTSAPETPQASSSITKEQLSEERGDLTSNDRAFDGHKYPGNGKRSSSSDLLFSEEEETAFLRSMGWEENADEDGLTEEEITAFWTKYINSKPSLKAIQGAQLKVLLPIDSQIGNVGGISTGLSSSNTKM